MTRKDFLKTVAQFQSAYGDLPTMVYQEAENLDALAADFKGSAPPDDVVHAIAVCAQMCVMLVEAMRGENE